MRAPAVSFVRKIVAAAAVGLLACGLALPHASAFAEGEDAPSALLASSLMDGSASVVREDVALAAPEDDAAPEPVIGSFTVDGLTFAVTEGSNVQLVGVAAVEADASTVVLSESATYEGVEYAVTSIGAYAFYLSGVTSVELPASITEVDDCAFRSSDVAAVEVADGNPTYSSFDGALYDADQLSLLLIPEGKQGTVLLPKTAETASPSVFSHCPLVNAISVEEGSAAFASENGLLYASDLTTLLRVPAGAAEITICEGCTTIADGALEACAQLTTINAPASVTSISPYLFEQQPETVMAPVAVAAVEDDVEADLADEGEPVDAAPQLSAMVALSAADDRLLSVDASAINLLLPVEANTQPWQTVGFLIEDSVGEEAASDRTKASPAIIAQDVFPDGVCLPGISLQTFSVAKAFTDTLTFQMNPSTETYLCMGAQPQQNASPIDVSLYQNQSKITVYATSAPSSYAPRIYEPGSAQSMWYIADQGIFRFGWWDGLTTASSPIINYYVDAKRPGYTPNQVVNSKGGVVCTPSNTTAVVMEPNEVYTISGWTKKPAYSITLDKNGGSIDRARYYWPDMGYVSTLSSTTVIGPGSTLISTSLLPTRAGYTFAGYWDTPDATGGTMYIDEQGKLTADAEPFESAGKLYARWTKNPVYAITLMQNTTNTTAWYTKVYLWYGKGWYGIANPEDDTAPLASLGISPSWAGRTYKGFSTDKNASTADYWADLSTMPSVTAFNSSQSLYAVWEKNPVYKVTIDPGSGTGGTSEIYLWYGKGWYSISNPTDSSTAISTMAFPWNPGYSPTGCWSSLTSSNRLQYVDADGNITAGTEAVTQDTTWYVGWSKRPVCAITLDPNGGIGGMSVVYQWTGRGWYGVASPNDSSTVMSAIVAPERTGYTFKGYATSQNATTAKYWTSLTSFPLNTEFASATKLYAVWALNTSTVTFDAGAGTLNPSLKPPLSITYGASSYHTYSYLKATRAGYVFGGWFDANGNQAWDGDGNAVEGIYWSKSGTTWAWHYDGDVELIAKWYATLTFDANGGKIYVYTGSTNLAHPPIDVRQYQEMDSLVVYEVGADNELAIYDSTCATQAWFDGPTIRASFWDGNGWNNYGLRFERSGYEPAGMTGTNPELTTASGSTTLVSGAIFQAQWRSKTINITWDSNGGSEVAGTSATYSETAKVPMPDNDPSLAGKKFAGWFTEKEDSKGDQVTANTSLPTSDVTYYARWVDPASITFDANGGKMYLYTGSVSNEDKLVDLSKYQNMESNFTIYETGTGGTPAILSPDLAKSAFLAGESLRAGWWDEPNGNNYGLRMEYPGYSPIGISVSGVAYDLTPPGKIVPLITGSYCVAQWRPNCYTVAFDANGADAAMPEAMAVDYEQGAVLPEASAQGLAFRGWNTKSDGTGDSYQSGDVCDTLTQADGATVTLYAQWAPIVSADAPLDVTVSVDLLGIEDQVPASGYIESRSGGALKVAAIDFTPLDGATALFGSSTADVALEALAGERATAADVSFSLDAKATETDSAKLAAFALPDGFGTKMPIGYRFAIPEDVLASIDPARFEQVTTPVCSVVYTVALAS